MFILNLGYGRFGAFWLAARFGEFWFAAQKFSANLGPMTKDLKKATFLDIICMKADFAILRSTDAD